VYAATDYYETLAAAYVRGKLAGSIAALEHSDLFDKPLEQLDGDESRRLMALGKNEGLRLHRFKRSVLLPRVRVVLGMLAGIQPTELLDIGSGRGAFLWPLLDTFPGLPVTALDLLDYRVADLQAVRAGGITTLDALHGDIITADIPPAAYDVLTMLEVLEHIPDTRAALRAAARAARRFLILSVPSKPDGNPEHIHRFDEETLRALLKEVGLGRISVEYVRSHILVVARRAEA
jgi:2-polyprenyl-3-methyl-5-hydroxy-6-metoxy-1,4-benzoquinol methylase